MNHVNSSFLSVYHTPFLTPELSSISSNTHSNQVPSKHIPLFWSNACVCSSGHEQLLCLNFYFFYMDWVGSQLLTWYSQVTRIHAASFSTMQCLDCPLQISFQIDLFFPSFTSVFLSFFPWFLFITTLLFRPSLLVHPYCSSETIFLFLATILNPISQRVQHAYKGWC